MSFNKGYKVENGVIDGGSLDLPSHNNYGILFLDMLRQYKDKTCLIDGLTGEKITFNELVGKVINVAASLQRLGVKQRDVVAICSENRIEFIVTVFAVVYIGGVANFINCAYSKDEIIHSTEISKPKYMFFSTTTYDNYYETISSLGFVNKHFIFGDPSGSRNAISFEDLVQNNTEKDSLKAANTEGSNPAIIVYSSGTTGLPKGLIWTHRGLIVCTLQPIWTEQDLTFLSVAPWTNTVGYILGMEVIANGRTMVFLSRFTETRYLETIEKYKVGFLLAVPPLVVFLSKSSFLSNYDISSVKMILSGGASLEAKVIEEVFKRLPNLQYVFQGYGMSEGTGALTMAYESANKLGSVGRVVPGIIVKIVDIDSKKVVGPKHPGEVYIKGMALFGGYVGRDRGDDYDEEGFYKTGDIAYYDEDGYFYIVDRIKELIKYNSWQVAPSELEAVLLQHPGVKDSAVIGIPDPSAGELPFAFIVKQPGANLTDKEITEYVASKVSPWKRLRGGVSFVAEIPKNGSGKILRKELKKLLKTKSKL